MTRIDRRALFATGSAAALLAAVGVSADAAPTRGGELRAALSGGDRTEKWLHQPGGRFLQAARGAVFETLTEIAPDGTLQPGLATNWHASEGGVVWQFSLRDDVTFHDGALLNVRDVVVSLRAHGLDASGGDMVSVRLAAPDAGFPFRAARDGLVIFKADEVQSGAPLHGTGLYRVARFDAGRSFVGERVSEHRKDGAEGWFDRVELVALSDQGVRADALRRGMVDVVDLSSAHDLDTHTDIRLITDADRVGAAVHTAIRHNMRTGPHPLDDMKFVQRWWRAI